MTTPDIGPPPDFRAIFEQAPGAYLILTPALRIVAVSDAYLDATMTKREQILGRPLFEVFPDNPAEPGATGVANLRASLERVLARKKPDAMAIQKYDVPRPGGGFERKFWRPLNTPVLDAQGQLRQIIHQVEDVTGLVTLRERIAHADSTVAQQQKELTTLRQAALFQLLVHQVKDYAIFLLDPQGRVMTWNEGAQRLKGYTVDEVMGKPLSTFFPAEDVQANLPCRLIEEATRLDSVETEGWRVGKGGKRFWAHVTLTALRDERGELFGYVEVARDLTARRQLEFRLQARSEELEGALRMLQDTDYKFRSITESTDDLIYIKDLDGRFIHVNPAAAALIGKQPGEVVGLRDVEILDPERSRRFRMNDQTVIETGQRMKFEEHLRHPDGRECTYWATKYPYLSPDGEVIGVIGIARDITEQKRAAEELFRKTLELKKSRELNQLKDHFLSTISHEMKTPLALLAGYTELLEDTGPSEAIIEGLKDGTRRLTAHIEQILDYSALLSGTLPLYKTEVDLAEVARQVAGVVQERVRRKELAFALAVDPGTPPIQGDFRRLVQMILALLDNAEKFTPARGQIGLRIGPSDGLVRIDVWDTGPGIPEADFARIWEAFSQLELGDADSKGGLGLGLTIVKQLAELHGGKVGVVSLPGKGTTFSLLLPVGAAQPPLSEPAGPPPSQGQP